MAGEAIRPGKLPGAVLAGLLRRFSSQGARQRSEIRLGPAVGEDACALDIPAGTLVAATDPVTLTTSELGRYAVTVNANDVAVCGVRPRWFLAAVLLPVGTTVAGVEELFGAMGDALQELGVALVGGHTEVTAAVSQQVVVGQMLGLKEDGRVLATAGAEVGDVVVQVGPLPVEGAAVLATGASARLTGLPSPTLAAAQAASRVPGISVVESALAAAAAGATAMHDPTEGGLASGLHEMAAAAGVAIRVDPDAVLWFEPGVAVCRALGADPWATLASGALLATFPSGIAPAALDTLATQGYGAAAIGTVEVGRGVHDLAGSALPWPDRDEAARVLSE